MTDLDSPSSPTAPLEILILGTGSIGAVYSYFFTKAGANVTAVCRSNYEAIRKDGITISSKTLGTVHCRPHRVVKSTRDPPCRGVVFHYVVVTTKSFPEDAAVMDAIEAVVTPRDSTTTTTKTEQAVPKHLPVIVLVQNGIGIEEQFHTRFPRLTLISGVVYLPASQPSPGKISMNGPDLLELGHYPALSQSSSQSSSEKSTKDESILVLRDLLTRAGATCVVVQDIQRNRWRKTLINACWNPIAALTRCTDADFVLADVEGSLPLCRAVMEEILSVAHARGYRDLTEADLDVQLDRAVQRAKDGTGIKMSMLADLEAGRAMEVDAILGNTLALGREANLHLPRLEMLYLLTKARGQQLMRDARDSFK